jgi:hypothetical protein
MQLAKQPSEKTADKPAAAPKRMSLGAVRRGRIEKPYRIVVFGPEGVGKSTFAAGAPNTIFLGAEDGTSELDVARLPQPTNWEDALDAVELLRNDKHDFGALAIDTLDWLEPLCWEKVCRDGKKKDIEDFGYGRGYTAALDHWREFLHRLTGLRDERNMYIVLLAHSMVRTFRNPQGEDFDRYEMKMHAKTAGLVREWCDALLFANYETLAYESKGRTRGVSDGARFIHTEHNAAFDAKNRQALPARLPLSWDEFVGAAKAGAPIAEDRVRKEIADLLPHVPRDIAEKAVAAIEGADVRKLAVIADRLRARAADNATDNDTKENQ